MFCCFLLLVVVVEEFVVRVFKGGKVTVPKRLRELLGFDACTRCDTNNFEVFSERLRF